VNARDDLLHMYVISKTNGTKIRQATSNTITPMRHSCRDACELLIAFLGSDRDAAAMAIAGMNG
jgi:hypothetical protein